MIQENELRIGNWVCHDISEWSYRNENPCNNGWNGLFQWNSTDWHALGECTLSLSNINLIPLTEEILLKCGFEIDETYRREDGVVLKTKDNFYIFKKENEFYLFNHIDEDYFYSFYSNKIKSVHHLQNLYFYQLEKELEIKP